MDHLADVTVDDLHDALDEVEGKRPTQRLLAAIAYENGVSQTELAEWHDVERKTVYSWLRRFDADQPVEEVVRDRRRPGRPRKLSEAQRRELGRTLRESPTDAGYDAAAWTPELVRSHLRATHDVDYSIPSCRRLMKEAGLRYRRQPDGSGSAGETDEGGRWTPR